MTKEQQERLFQPFDRLGAERSGVPGSGLGLVIARELTRAMGGELSVQSAPKVGTTFTVAVPAPPRASESPSEAREAGPASVLSPGGDAVAAMQRHVLYIEDEAVNVLLMQEVFRLRPNWRLTVAGEGAEGVGRAIEERPDLILVDMNLPDMSGLQVIEQLRASEATRYLPCIALSADALREQIDAALRAGFDEYWTKPIDIARVLANLGNALTDRYLSRSTA
jgi:CheY-like chemotaxis protein